MLIGLGCLVALLLGLRLGMGMIRLPPVTRCGAGAGLRVVGADRGLPRIGRHHRRRSGARVGSPVADAGHPGPDLRAVRPALLDVPPPEPAARADGLDLHRPGRRGRPRVHGILRGIPRADDDGGDGDHRRIRSPAAQALGGARHARHGHAAQWRDLDGHPDGVPPRLRGPGVRHLARCPPRPDRDAVLEVDRPLPHRDRLRRGPLRRPALGHLLPGAGAGPGPRA